MTNCAPDQFYMDFCNFSNHGGGGGGSSSSSMIMSSSASFLDMLCSSTYTMPDHALISDEGDIIDPSSINPSLINPNPHTFINPDQHTFRFEEEEDNPRPRLYHTAGADAVPHPFVKADPDTDHDHHHHHHHHHHLYHNPHMISSEVKDYSNISNTPAGCDHDYNYSYDDYKPDKDHVYRHTVNFDHRQDYDQSSDYYNHGFKHDDTTGAVISGSRENSEISFHHKGDHITYSNMSSMEKDQEDTCDQEKLKKKIKRANPSQPKISLHTRSDVDILDDGFRWRKYGQKAVKNNIHPRSYYRCTNINCLVKKRVERLAKDSSIVVTTYQGVHNHHCESSLTHVDQLNASYPRLAHLFQSHTSSV